MSPRSLTRVAKDKLEDMLAFLTGGSSRRTIVEAASYANAALAAICDMFEQFAEEETEAPTTSSGRGCLGSRRAAPHRVGGYAGRERRESRAAPHATAGDRRAGRQTETGGETVSTFGHYREGASKRTERDGTHVTPLTIEYGTPSIRSGRVGNVTCDPQGQGT